MFDDLIKVMPQRVYDYIHDCDDPLLMYRVYSSQGSVYVTRFKITKETKCKYFYIDDDGKERSSTKKARRSFAYKRFKEAMHSFLMRKYKQREILEKEISNVSFYISTANRVFGELDKKELKELEK